MIYQSAQQWQDDPHKRVLLFGMSGLGKTHVSRMLHGEGDWFHYSVDYRIGTKYLGGQLAALAPDDGARVSINNLAPLAQFLGKPGDPAKGGIPIGEFKRRQALHQQAEIAALLDTEDFIARARADHAHFICDTGGSICEVVNPDDRNDPVLQSLSRNLLLVWIQGADGHNAELVCRFDASPKPMCYRTEFLDQVWAEYLNKNNVDEGKVDPDDFVRFAFTRALDFRQPRYAAMARNWGVAVTTQSVASATNATAFNAMIADALENQPAPAYLKPSS